MKATALRWCNIGHPQVEHSHQRHNHVHGLPEPPLQLTHIRWVTKSGTQLILPPRTRVRHWMPHHMALDMLRTMRMWVQTHVVAKSKDSVRMRTTRTVTASLRTPSIVAVASRAAPCCNSHRPMNTSAFNMLCVPCAFDQ